MTLPALLREALQSGEISSREATKAFLLRIERLDPAIGAFITVAADAALAQARAADDARTRGELLGPLHGLPIALKDNVDTAGLRTTVGSSFFAERVPDEDAQVAARLRAAGAVLLGKTSLHEFAFGATNQNPHFGPCRNPWDLSRVPGGSSGGSGAAVAAGLCAAAIGTDTGGSVRIPAALTGVSGLRSSRGRVSTQGVFPTSWTLDTAGPLARSVSELAAVYGVIAGYDPADPGSVDVAVEGDAGDPGDLSALVIALPTNYFFDDVDPQVARLVRAAADVFASLGARLTEIELAGADDALRATSVIILAEAYAVHRTRLQDHPEGFGKDIRRRLERGAAITAAEYAEARQAARVWCRTLANAFADADLILSPSTPTAAPRASNEMITATHPLASLTYPWSVAGLPGLSIPCGLTDERLPVGLQVVAPRFHEALLLRAGSGYQLATSWHERKPPVGAAPTT